MEQTEARVSGAYIRPEVDRWVGRHVARSSIGWSYIPVGFGEGQEPLRSPWPGVSVSLCLSVSLTLPFSKRPLCVGVCRAATLRGQAGVGGGGGEGEGKAVVSRLLDSKGLFSACPPHLTHPTQLYSPDRSGSCPALGFYENFVGLSLEFSQSGADGMRSVRER